LNQTAKDGDMASLIDNIISLEKEADLILEEAQASSKNIHKATEDDIVRYRDELAGELEIRLKQFKAEAEKRYQDALAEINRKRSGKLDSLTRLSDDYIVLQARKIIDRFNNW
jgi:F0F1-type ATP synthase membrane subunit b/b'